LSASLRALRAITDDLTAVVTVGDDGGSSGVLRRDLGVLPPGDLRMALNALGGNDPQARRWSEVIQHRFDRGALEGHPVGNVVLAALLETSDDPVEALDAMADLIGAQGRVLPMAEEPVDIVGQLAASDGSLVEVRGQSAVAATPGVVAAVALEPAEPAPCAAAVHAVLEADLVVLGPGSWFTSVVPHLLVRSLADALVATDAVRVVTLNLVPQPGETHGFAPHHHLEVLMTYAEHLRVDAVIADREATLHDDRLAPVASALGAVVIEADVADARRPGQHAPLALAAAYAQAWERGRIAP
jgi:uncharacterized cofD-like protein